MHPIGCALFLFFDKTNIFNDLGLNTMTSKLTHILLPQTNPSLNILRLAALSAGTKEQLDYETLVLMRRQVKSGVLKKLIHAKVWQELIIGLMAQTPSNMIRVLLDCGALAHILPEIVPLFEVHQIANDPHQVNIGSHLLRVLDEAARCNAPLPVRFAALVMNVGKSDSPPEHLPVHYRHIDRGHIRIVNICERMHVPEDCREMALLALAECERIHRASEVRAGPVASMLERLGAFDNKIRFEQIMMLCACDYRAYPGYDGSDYPKSILLKTALKACTNIDETNLSADTLQETRAAAIAKVFRSERWAEGKI
jgi:tRNA nucleotidyltransferase (CCA-adding enzyme)